MGGLFGGRSIASTPPAIGGLKVQQSVYGAVISMVYGQTRIPGNLIWYGDFVATAHDTSQGGKGGGEVKSTSYTYSAAVALGLCEGPIGGIATIWQGKAQLDSTGGSTTETVFDEPAQVPGTGPYQISVTNVATWIDDRGVFVFDGDRYVPLQHVTGAPGDLQYSVAAGVYTFSATNAALSVYISYDYTQASGSALAQAGLSLFTGSNPQSPWGYLTTAHPGQDLGYQGLAYVAGAGVSLDAGGVLPAYNFEIVGLNQFGGGVVDANPKVVAYDLLTNPFYGAAFPSAQIGDWTQWSNYCIANSIFVSPAYTSQRSAADILLELADITNTAIVFSEGVLKMRPYGDQAATAHSVTYTPDSTVWYDMGDGDYLDSGGDPVVCTRGNPADAFNSVSVEILNRANQYNVETVEATDSSSISLVGRRPQSVIQMHAICDVSVARGVSQRKLQRGLYIRNEYQFTLGWKYFLLEPMDIITLTDAYLGLDHAPVRITSIEEDEDGQLLFTAEEFPGQVSHNAVYPSQDTDSYSVNFAVSPGIANAPIIFPGPLQLTNNALEIWVAASGSDVNYGGCEIWISNDNATYRQAARINGSCRMGVTTTAMAVVADPDTTTQLGVNLAMSAGVLQSGSQLAADQLTTLCYVDGEFISYRDANLTSANHYTLNYLRRGVYGSTDGIHTSGVSFARVDALLAKISISQEDVTTGLYVKLRAFNRYGQGFQNLADCVAYTYNVGAPVPPKVAAVTGLELVGQGLDTVFTGRDAKFDWRPNSLQNSYNIGSEPYGGNSGSNGAYFRDYEIRIYNTAATPVLLRTEHTTDTFWTYTYEKNFEDTNGVPNRTFTIKVYQRGQQGQLSEIPATLTVSNPAPPAPTGLATVSLPGGWGISANVPNITDLAGMEVWMSATSGFTPSDANKVYDGPSNAASAIATAGTALYFRLAFYDTFGKTVGELNLSTESTATPIKVGIQDVGILPSSGMQTGDVVYYNVDKKLYRYDGSSWVTWTDGSDILASSVTAGKINVINLAAISANMGHIIAGDITLDSSGFIKGGQTGYNAGSGFWLGYNGAAYKMSIGTSGGSSMTYDGSTLTVAGDVVTSGQVKASGSFSTGIGGVGNTAIFGNSSGTTIGVVGYSSGSGAGIFGFSSTGTGVFGQGDGTSGIGVSGTSSGSSGIGVKGFSNGGTSGKAIYGTTTTGYGVYGDTNSGTAGYFSALLSTGTALVSDGQFKSTGSVLITGALKGTLGTGLELGLSTQSTVGASGTASPPPANPNGYLLIYVSGTKLAIPTYLP